MDFFRKLAQQLRAIWQGMARPQKVAVVLASALCATALIAVTYWSSQTDYQVLYSGLSAEDAGAVTSKLQARSISYRLAAGGTTVLVPTEQAQQCLVELAADGLPAKGGRGFEIFDQTSLGATPFTQHVNYLRALQGELAKTIMQIDPVVFARVHIVRPEPSAFVRDQKPTTASVFLKLRPGASLSRNVAAAISALVARSVEGLTKENVTLVDANGRLLSEPHDPETGTVGSQIEQQRELERYLANKAETMLAQVLGPGRAVVRVTADLNLKRLREKKEMYDPEKRVAISETIRSNKSSSGASGNKSSPVGVGSNLGKPAAPGTPTGSDSREETVETSYAVSKVTQELEDRWGAIERLTVAALVDQPRPAEGSGGTEESTISAGDLQDIIKKAVGFKAERDEIKVIQVRMADLHSAATTLDDDWTRLQQWQQTLALVRNASLGVTALAAVVLAWMLLRRKGPGPAPEKQAPADPEQTAALERIAAALQRDPDAFGKVLSDWLKEPEPTTRKAA